MSLFVKHLAVNSRMVSPVWPFCGADDAVANALARPVDELAEKPDLKIRVENPLHRAELHLNVPDPWNRAARQSRIDGAD